MTTIIVGVDKSQHALAAAQKAFELAKALGAELHIVTAVTTHGSYDLGEGSDRFVVNDVDVAEHDLLAMAAGFRGSVTVSTSAVTSDPVDALCSEASRLQASMIVIGNKRVQGVARVLGSIAGSVAKQAPCDVYIVHTYD